MELALTQIVIIGLTIAAALGGGIYAARSVHSAESYTLGGRSAGVPLVAGTIAGTCIGGGATVGTAQLAASIGLSAWWFTLGTGLSLILMGLFYARPLRKSALETISQYLVLNYGNHAGHFTTVVSSLGIFFSAVASCLPGIALIATLLHLPLWAAALILTLLVAAYCFFGGLKSAGVGGMIKAAILWVSLCLAGIAAWQSITQDSAVAAALPAFPWFSLAGNGVQNALTSVLSVIVGMLCTQSYIQAIFAAATPRTAAVGAFTAALIALPVGLPCALIGMYVHAAHPEVAPMLTLPYYLLQEQPVLLGSIAMGGIILSLIGSIAGLSLGIGTMLTRDVVARVLHVTDGRQMLRLSRLVVLSVILAAAGFAELNEGSQVLFWNYLSMALRGGGIFLPLTFAVFIPHAIEDHWALASMVLSTGTAIAAALLGSPISPLFIGLTVSLLVLIPGWLHQHHHDDNTPMLATE